MAKSKPKSKSKSKSKPVTIAGLKRAIEGRKAPALADFYADDAVVRVIDRDNPPSQPRNLEGKSAISAYFGDVCGRSMTHKVDNGIAVGNRLAFTQSCAYPDGTKVFARRRSNLRVEKLHAKPSCRHGMAEPASGARWVPSGSENDRARCQHGRQSRRVGSRSRRIIAA